MSRFLAGVSSGLLIAVVVIIATVIFSDSKEDGAAVLGLCERSSDHSDYLAGSVVARAVPDAVFQMSPSIDEADYSSESYQIVFPKEEQEGNWSLYLMRLNSGDPERLTNSTQSDWYPSWSPDGKEVVFTRRVPGTRESSIYIVDVETRKERVLTSPPEGFADKFAYWSPEGKRLVFIRESSSEPFGTQQLFLVNSDGSNQTEIFLGDGYFEVELMPH